MTRRPRPLARSAAGVWLVATAVALLSTGCSTVGFYAQAAGGHLDLLQRARPVQEVLDDPATGAALRQRLRISQQMRDFASSVLQLPANNSYRRYADLQRDAVVWNVVAAQELSLQLKTWCFPLMGCVGYRGYFQRARADALATELKAAGLETNTYGVPAYSTLGWSNWVGGDPLLNTFVQGSELELARLIFHELAHQVAYAADDTTFNESFAVAVERIGGRRWLALHGGAQAQAAADAADARLEQRRDDFRAFTARWRAQLERLYSGPLPDDAKRMRKAELMAAMRSDFQAMKAQRWGGGASASGYDGWVERANNASFAVLGAYNDLVPQFERLFAQCDGDFARFYAKVQALAAKPKAERRDTLAAAGAKLAAPDRPLSPH